MLISVTEQGTDMIERMLERGKSIASSLNDIPQERLDGIVSTIDEATEMLKKMTK